MQTIINICLRKNKSKQSYVWIDSIFEAQSICFGTEKAGLFDFSYNKCALEIRLTLLAIHLNFSEGLKMIRNDKIHALIKQIQCC